MNPISSGIWALFNFCGPAEPYQFLSYMVNYDHDDDSFDFNVPFSILSAISAQPPVCFCSANDRIYGGGNDRARPTAVEIT